MLGPAPTSMRDTARVTSHSRASCPSTPAATRGASRRVATMAPDRQAVVLSDLESLRRRMQQTASAPWEQRSRQSSSSSSSATSAVATGSAFAQQRFGTQQPLVSTSGSSAAVGSWHPKPHHLGKHDLWRRIRAEAVEDAASEASLGSFLYSTILSHSSFEETLAFLLSNKLSNRSTLLESVQLMQLFQRAFEADSSIAEAAVADLLVIRDRDPACEKYSQALLYFKGYQAIQTHRVAHWLWTQGRQALALSLQSRASEIFHVDIHPGARIGRGLLLDHASGVVIGETAVVGDNVSMLHRVSLGGSGTDKGIRHPTIGDGVLLGAGVSVLGSIHVGAGSKVGAGSVVVNDLPPHSVAVGVPARVIKRDVVKEPESDMDQCLSYIFDYVI